VDGACRGVNLDSGVPKWLLSSIHLKERHPWIRLPLILHAAATGGVDLTKHIFQVHAIDAAGRAVVFRALRRKDLLAFFECLPSCLIGMEACGSAHYWARQLMKLGHDVRLMAPAYVKPYVRRHKNDAADAAAICEAVTRPCLRYVPVRSVENWAAFTDHKPRDLLVA